MHIKGSKWKGRKRPSSDNSHRKSRTWVSLVEKTDGKTDQGQRRQDSWYMSPMMKEARIKKWSKT